MRYRSILMNLVLCITALGAGMGAFGALSAMRQEAPKGDPIIKTFNVQVFEVSTSDVQEIIRGFGSVQALHEVEYSAQIAGEVTSVSQRLKVGEAVEGPAFSTGAADPGRRSQQTPGELLLTIDPEVYQERLQQADDSIAEAQSELRRLAQEEQNIQRILSKSERDYTLSRDEHARMQKLFRDGSITESQLAESQLDLQRYEESQLRLQNDLALIPARRDQIQTRQSRLQTDRKLAAIDLERTEVRPPFSGVLSEVHVEKGQYVQPGAKLFRVTQVDRVEIPVPLHPADHARVAALVTAGEQPAVELAENEIAESQWRGAVVRIAPVADRQTRTVNVFVEVRNVPGQPPLLPGTFVQTRINGPVMRQVLAVPREAVLGGNPRHGRVLVEQDGIAQEIPVTISRRMEGMALIESGLAPGHRVILTNLDILTTGSRVAVQSVRTLTEVLDDEVSLRPLLPASELP